MRKNKKGCISPDKVPCEKARAYLEKRGLICGVEPEKPVKPSKRVKSFFKEWFD